MRDHYEAVAITHHQIASQAAIALIPDATPQSAQMLFVFSVLTTYYGESYLYYLRAQHKIAHHQPPSALGWPRKTADTLLLDANSGFPDWVYLLRGIKGFIELAGVPRDGPLAPVFAHSTHRFVLREEAEVTASPAHPGLTELEQIIARRPALDDGLRAVYAAALAELKKSFGQAEALALAGMQYEMIDAFIWLFVVAEDLVPLLRAPKQEAVAIFAFFCVLLKKLDGQWWMQGWGTQLITNANELLDEEGRLWIHWAVQEMGWVPPSAVERSLVR
jgi:hypothetical protein